MAEALKPINGGGLQLTPFNTHKRWIVTNHNFRTDYYQVSILKGVSPGLNEKINVSESIGAPAYRETDQQDNAASNSTPFLNSKHQKIIYSGVNQMFFKHRVNYERDLYASASIFSIPHNRMGDGVKPGSILITDSSVSSSNISSITITDTKLDEYHGYLTDTGLNTSSYVAFGDMVGYWGFNDEVVPRTAESDSVIQDRSGYSHHATGKSLSYNGGIITTGFVEKETGTKVTFNGSTSYIKVDHNPQLDFFKNSNYAISVWMILPTSQSDTSSNYNWIISKRGTEKDYGQDMKLNEVLRYRNIESPIFPFDLKVINQNGLVDNGKIVASISDGLKTTATTSTTKVNDATQHHIVFNKTGSLLELYIDGIKEVSSSVNLKEQVSNTYDMLFGSEFTSDGYKEDVTSDFHSLSGSLDEIRFYRKALSQSEISSLSNNDYVTGSAYQTNVIGEVFYNHGIMVVSDPRPLYKNVWVGNDNWAYGTDYGFTTKYKSSKQLHEIALLCEIGADEFNVSQNPSLKKNNDINSEFLQPFVTGSDFAPYFTTIGLYNPNGDLIAISKLASAIKNRDDVDITIKVRLDLDGPFGTPSLSGSLEPDTKTALYKRKDGKSVWNKLDRPF